jgi:DtxR family transcriptional regulator, Mn-dependent transcriptional regulator
MKLSDRAEEILETLYVQTVENEKHPDLSLIKDDEAFIELVDNGYVSTNAEKIFTPKGRKEGMMCIRRHRLAERLLADVLNVKAGLVHETGCRIEHALHKGVEDNICTLLGHPSMCPHGQPIPQGKCCREKSTQPRSLVVPLADLNRGQSGRIAYLHTEDRGILRKIMAMGALPGASLTLVQKFPSYVFQIGQSQFAIDREMAERIYIWLLQ